MTYAGDSATAAEARTALSPASEGASIYPPLTSVMPSAMHVIVFGI